MHVLCQLGQMFAELNPGQRTGNRIEFTTSLGGSLWLHINRIHLWRTTIEVDIDDRFIG